MRKKLFLFLALLFAIATIYNFVGTLEFGVQNVTTYDILVHNLLPLLGCISYVILYFDYKKKNINNKQESNQ